MAGRRHSGKAALGSQSAGRLVTLPIRLRTAGRSGYRSSVCSTPETPAETALGDLARAIEELAADNRAGAAPGQLADRIARLWGMVTDLDPELARRRPIWPARLRASWPTGSPGCGGWSPTSTPSSPGGARSGRRGSGPAGRQDRPAVGDGHRPRPRARQAAPGVRAADGRLSEARARHSARA